MAQDSLDSGISVFEDGDDTLGVRVKMCASEVGDVGVAGKSACVLLGNDSGCSDGSGAMIRAMEASVVLAFNARRSVSFGAHIVPVDPSVSGGDKLEMAASVRMATGAEALAGSVPVSPPSISSDCPNPSADCFFAAAARGFPYPNFAVRDGDPLSVAAPGSVVSGGIFLGAVAGGLPDAFADGSGAAGSGSMGCSNLDRRTLFHKGVACHNGKQTNSN